MIRRQDHSQRNNACSNYGQKKFNLIKDKKCEANAKVNKYFASEKVKKVKMDKC